MWHDVTVLLWVVIFVVVVMFLPPYWYFSRRREREWRQNVLQAFDQGQNVLQAFDQVRVAVARVPEPEPELCSEVELPPGTRIIDLVD